jgi:hypothetical protein
MRMVSRYMEGRNIIYFINLLHSNKHLDMRWRGLTSLLPKRGIARPNNIIDLWKKFYIGRVEYNRINCANCYSLLSMLKQQIVKRN